MKKAVAILIFAAFCAYAERSVYGNENRFLFASPQYFAMGEAANALSDEPIPANNPASVILAGRTTFFASYTSFYDNILRAGNTYATLKIDSLNVASVFIGYLSIPDIDSVRRVYAFEGAQPDYEITQVSSSELSVNLNYARKILDFKRFNLSAGAALNVMRRRLIDWTGYGVGADLGILFATDRGNSVGFQVDNVTTHYTHWSSEYSENTLPQGFLSYGYSRKFSDNLAIKLVYRSPDLFGNSGVASSTLGKENQFEDKVRSGSIVRNPQNLFVAAGYGAQFTVKNIVDLRLGLTDVHKLTFGGGVYLFDRVNVDFAYVYSSALDGSYGISLKFGM